MAAVVQEDIQTKLIGLTTDAMEAFCEDISTMFDVEISSTPKQQGQVTIKGIQKLFKKVSAVHTVKAQGTLEGAFHLVFDQGGLFTLAGVFVMLPPVRILEEANRGTLKEAKAMSDTIGEVGNMLVGAWDRVFRKDCPGHKHFVKKNTFIGVPWDKSQDSIGLAEGEELEFALYEIDVKPYPAFSCAVIFPKKLLTAKSESSEVEEEPADPSKVEDEGETKVQAEAEPAPMSGAQDQSPPSSPQTQDVTSSAESAMPTAPTVMISGSSVVASLLNLSVKQIMGTEVVWIGPEDSVLDVLRQMQQHNAGYALVGQNGVLEGIVSKSNVLGGISPYLHPVFAKWRRPDDDATLNIKIKWLMSRPVQTLSVQATLGQAIERMQQFGGRCLPVVDEAGKVMGMVSVFDIFKALTPNKAMGKTPQAPCLMA
jgi:CBS domain-containing protein